MERLKEMPLGYTHMYILKYKKIPHQFLPTLNIKFLN